MKSVSFSAFTLSSFFIRPNGVLIGASFSQFTLTNAQDGNYTIVLKKEKDGFPRTLYIHDDEGDLVGKDTQPASAWTINGPDSNGFYTSVPICLLL